MLLAFFVVFALGAMLFNVAKIFGSKEGSHSPVEEAALAAANAVSSIVVNTPECGFVSLADQQPGSATMAADGYTLPVRSINSLVATARLDLIIADKLGEPLMEELAEQDLKEVLSAKNRLTSVIRESLLNGSATDRDGKKVEPRVIALNAFNKGSGRPVSSRNIHISLGSLNGGSTTCVPVPTSFSAVSNSQASNGLYNSFVNVPYKGTDFVFGGVAREPLLVDDSKWVSEIQLLPYQMPTIVRVQVRLDQGSKLVACAQPSSEEVPAPRKEALTISFPDGPVPEIKNPESCYKLEPLNSSKGDAMKLLTSLGGDYPSDSGSSLAALNWPITRCPSAEPTANVWRLALHDWIRRAGPLANIDSILAMQKIELDAPKPAKVMWKAPLAQNSLAVSIEPISSGIMHIFEFDPDGVVTYRSKALSPFPLNAVSQNQLFGEKFAALTFSDIGERAIILPTRPPKKVVLRPNWDVYIRDQVRHYGTIYGGKHGGEPIAKPMLAYFESLFTFRQVADNGSDDTDAAQGSEEAEERENSSEVPVQKTTEGMRRRGELGSMPLIAPQSGFAEGMNPPAPIVRPMPFGSGYRPFSRTSSAAVDITFRRQIDVGDLNGFDSVGYLGIIENEGESSRAD